MRKQRDEAKEKTRNTASLSAVGESLRLQILDRSPLATSLLFMSGSTWSEDFKRLNSFLSLSTHWVGNSSAPSPANLLASAVLMIFAAQNLR